MEVSEEDHIEFDIQNDAVYECEVRLVENRKLRIFTIFLWMISNSIESSTSDEEPTVYK